MQIHTRRPLRFLRSAALAAAALAPGLTAQEIRWEEEIHDPAELAESWGGGFGDDWGYDRVDDDHDYDFDEGGWYESDLAWEGEQEWYEFGEGWDDYDLDYRDYGSDWYDSDDGWVDYYEEAMEDVFGGPRRTAPEWRDEDELGWHREWDPTEDEYETTFGSYRVAPTPREEPRYGWHWSWDPVSETWERELGVFDEYWEDDAAVIWRDSPEDLRD